LAAPELIDLEVASAIRRQLRLGALDAWRAKLALRDLEDVALRRARHRPHLRRCRELRESLPVYDAAYVALAELLGVTLVTADARLASAPGVRCDVEVLA
jgi:predicted nucleic acid-binding protein